MATIDTFLSNILSAIYGKDVRQAIHDSISEINKESTSTKTYVDTFTKQIEQGVIGGKVELDTTLTQSGKAADAKAVGDALTKLEDKISESGSSGGNEATGTIEWTPITDGEIFELSTTEEPTVPVPCTGITLDKTELAFSNTETIVTLVATVTPSDTTDQIEWSVDNSGVATVDNGVVKAIANGSCVVTATCGAYSATCAVTVEIDTSYVSYTKENLDGYFDFIGVENGYFGTLTNKADSGTLTGEVYKYINYEAANDPVSVENGVLVLGATAYLGANGKATKMRVYAADTEQFYSGYPYSVEFYGKMGASDGTVNYSIDGHTILISTKSSDGNTHTGSGTVVYFSDDSTIRTGGAVGQGSNTITLDSAVDVTAYHHYVVVVDSALVRVYLDGVKVGEGTATNNSSMSTGNKLVTMSQNGHLKMVRVYNAILTDEQVANNYANTIDMYGGNA